MVLAIVGCSSEEESAAVRIGFLADRSASGAELAIEAAQLAVAEVNAAGGIDVGGRLRPVELLLEDTGDTPEGATRASIKLINQENVAAIIGSSFSRNAIPSSRVAEQAGVPMICPGATHPRVTAGSRFVFRVAFIDSFQGRVMARFAQEDLELTTAAVLYDVADTYSRDVAVVFRQVFEENGGRVVAFESFTTGEKDFTRQLEHIRDTDPEALFLPSFRHAVVAQTHQARRLGIDAIFLGSDGWPKESFENHDLNGAFLSLNWHPGLAAAYHETRDFIAQYRNAYGREPSGYGALIYDAFGLLFDAVGRASRTDPEAIREALSQTLRYPGVAGPITYRDRGGDPRRTAVIAQYANDELRFFKLVAPGPTD